jgi:hypothetical protein
MFAHKQDEHVPVAQVVQVAERLRGWLERPAPGKGDGADGRPAAAEGAQ